MSKNFNRAAFNKQQTSKGFKLKMFKVKYNYCFICSKRAGSHYYDCNGYSYVYKRHGTGKPIYNHKRREYLTWKYNHKTQFK